MSALAETRRVLTATHLTSGIQQFRDGIEIIMAINMPLDKVVGTLAREGLETMRVVDFCADAVLCPLFRGIVAACQT